MSSSISLHRRGVYLGSRLLAHPYAWQCIFTDDERHAISTSYKQLKVWYLDAHVCVDRMRYEGIGGIKAVRIMENGSIRYVIQTGKGETEGEWSPSYR